MTFSPICTLSEDDPPIRASRLALVTVFQFLENLTDRQAADAIRSRLDWKYAATVSKYLTQALTTPSSAQFRTRLVALAAEERLEDAVVALCKQHGWRHPDMDSNEPTRPMYWPEVARSAEQNA